MPYFKVVGGLLLLCCGGAVGVLLVSFERRRCRQAEGFVTLLRYIRVQIDCFSLPVAQILLGCDPEILTDCGVEGVKLTDFSALLESTPLYLPEEMCRLLAEFAAQLGGSYREEQLRCCDHFVSRLAPLSDRLRAELPKRVKTVLILPIAAAAAAILLLL